MIIPAELEFAFIFIVGLVSAILILAVCAVTSLLIWYAMYVLYGLNLTRKAVKSDRNGTKDTGNDTGNVVNTDKLPGESE